MSESGSKADKARARMLADALCWQAEAADLMAESLERMRQASRLELIAEVCSDATAEEIFDRIEAGELDVDSVAMPLTSPGGLS